MHNLFSIFFENIFQKTIAVDYDDLHVDSVVADAVVVGKTQVQLH